MTNKKIIPIPHISLIEINRGKDGSDLEQKSYISEALRKKVFHRDGYKCVRCGLNKCLHCDHAKSKLQGGETKLNNLQTLCADCNSKKGARSWWSPVLQEYGIKEMGGEKNLELLYKRTRMRNF